MLRCAVQTDTRRASNVAIKHTHMHTLRASNCVPHVPASRGAGGHGARGGSLTGQRGHVQPGHEACVARCHASIPPTNHRPYTEGGRLSHARVACWLYPGLILTTHPYSAAGCLTSDAPAAACGAAPIGCCCNAHTSTQDAGFANHPADWYPAAGASAGLRWSAGEARFEMCNTSGVAVGVAQQCVECSGMQSHWEVSLHCDGRTLLTCGTLSLHTGTLSLCLHAGWANS